MGHAQSKKIGQYVRDNGLEWGMFIFSLIFTFGGLARAWMPPLDERVRQSFSRPHTGQVLSYTAGNAALSK